MQAANRFGAEGGVRYIVFDGTQVATRDNQNLRYLEHLLRSAGREFSGRELYALAHGQTSPLLIPLDWEDARLWEGDGAPQAVLDPDTLNDVRRRLRELKQQRAEAEASGDEADLARVDAETEELERYLKPALGLGGRPRAFNANDERARKAVWAGLHRARAAIRRVHPALADHLDCALSTKDGFAYRPNPPVEWSC
jgi:hypothetical protein